MCSSSSSTVSIRTLAAASHQLSLFEPVPIQPASLLLTEHVRPLALVRLSFRDLGLFSSLANWALVCGEMGEQANDPTYIGFSCIAEQYQRKVNLG